MTPGQIWEARIRLSWSRDKLAEMSGVPVGAVIDFERADRPISHRYSKAMGVALEAAGVEFTNDDQPEGRQILTPDQVKAARALLGWTRVRLASQIGAGEHVVAVFERAGYVPRPISRDPDLDRLADIRGALEQAGIEFTNGDAPGVRLRDVRT